MEKGGEFVVRSRKAEVGGLRGYPRNRLYLATAFGLQLPLSVSHCRGLCLHRPQNE